MTKESADWTWDDLPWWQRQLYEARSYAYDWWEDFVAHDLGFFLVMAILFLGILIGHIAFSPH